jgi:hypothetical protein
MPDTSAEEQHATGIDALRHAVRTAPKEHWHLVAASKAMYGTPDYDRVRARTGGYNWTFTGDRLDDLVREGWLHRPDGIDYVPTDAAKSTWPTD